MSNFKVNPCPGCGKRWCIQWGDECWRNNGCPATPPVAPEPDRSTATQIETPLDSTPGKGGPG